MEGKDVLGGVFFFDLGAIPVAVAVSPYADSQFHRGDGTRAPATPPPTLGWSPAPPCPGGAASQPEAGSRSPALTATSFSPFAGLQSMPGDYVSRGSPMGMNMGQPSYTPPQMPPHPAQLRHGPPMHTYIPGHPHHPAMMMHGGPPHPGMPMSASTPTMLHTGEPAVSGQVMDIHAQ